MADGDGMQIVRSIPFGPAGPMGANASSVTGPNGQRMVVLTVETLTAHNVFFMDPDFAFQVVSRLNDAIREARRPALIRPVPGIAVPILKPNGKEPA